MAAGKETYHSLRQYYRAAEYRRFRARHRNNRWADFLGFMPGSDVVIGFWDGSDEPTKFDGDDIQWCKLITYV